MYALPLQGGHPGLYGRHSRSLGMWPFDREADKVVQPVAPLDTTNLEQALPITMVQQALAAHFGATAMGHSCGPEGCDGRWGPGTERQLDRVFDLLNLSHSQAEFEVKGSMVVLPAAVARWVQQKVVDYRAPAATPPGVPQPAALPEEPYESPHRRKTNVWLIVGGVTAALGVGALGFVVWKKRGRR